MRQIMAVKREILLSNDYFEGFAPPEFADFESRILANFEYLERDPAEEDRSYKQPITYCMIFNPELRQVFFYQRAIKDRDYPEKRLQGKWAVGVGGHIERVDESARNPILAGLHRELKEELSIVAEPRVFGYINNEDDVGSVHFGVLYIAETALKTITPTTEEIASGRLRTLSEIEVICANPVFVVEEWAKIALRQLTPYL